MDSKVQYGQEHGINLIKIAKRLAKNQDLLRLLVNTDLDPLNKEKNPEEINWIPLMNKNIKTIPLLTPEKEDVTSKIVIMYDSGDVGIDNMDNEVMSLLIHVYCPFETWQIVGDNLRPFAIMAQIRKSIQGIKVNGLGELVYLGFSIGTLTEEMGSYIMRFRINAFS